MKTKLNSKDYVTFARRFVKETVATMDIEELRSLVTDRIHDEIQEGENEFGQSGAFDEMIAWNEDVFLSVAKDYNLKKEVKRMTKQKTYTVKISRDFIYEYEVKANNEDDAIQKAYDDWDGETDDVELIDEECYQADCTDCEELEE